MPRIEILDTSGAVANVIEADSDFAEAQHPGKWHIANEQTPPAPSLRLLSHLAFLRRFTDEEAIAFDLASIGESVEAATMRRYLSKVNAAAFIDLDHNDIRTGVQALESAGLLSEGRASEILNTGVAQDEAP